MQLRIRVQITMVDTNVKLYRSSALCDLLTDTLEEMCDEEKMTEELAHKVLEGFDHCCLDALSKKAESKSTLQVWSLYALYLFELVCVAQGTTCGCHVAFKA